MIDKIDTQKRKCRLSFLGNGNAFSKTRGNNSAYMEMGKELIIIDCGEDVFHKILNKGLFENKSRVHFFITHLHSDHVGSLPSAIAYLYNVVFEEKRDNICVYFPNEALRKLLKLQGIDDRLYSFFINRWDEIKLEGYDEELEYIFEENEHVDELDYNGNKGTFSVELIVKNHFNIYFSSDSAGVKERITRTKIYDEIYHEAASIKTKAHTSYDEIKEAFSSFSKSEKSRIWLMHLDDEFDEKRALEDGFNVTFIK